MKKKLISLVLALTMLTTLATGCSSSGDANENTANNNEQTTTEDTSNTNTSTDTEDTTDSDTEQTEDTGTENTAVSLTEAEIESAVAAYAEYQPAKDTYEFTFIPKLVHTWYEDVRVGIETAIAELEAKGITVNYTWDAPTQAVVTEQIEKMESAAANMPDGISVAIIDPSSETSIVDELIAAGIRVSTFDVDAPDSDRLFYCGHSTNYADGYEIANRVCEAMGGKGQIGILAGSLSAVNHQERVQGVLDCIEQNWPEIEVVDQQADEDSVETAISVTESYISAYPEIGAIIGVNAAVTGSCRAVSDAGLSGKVLIAGFAEDQEAMQYVKDGTLFCTLKQDVQAYGYHSVYNMIMLADDAEPVNPNFELAAIFVTAENVDEYLQ